MLLNKIKKISSRPVIYGIYRSTIAVERSDCKDRAAEDVQDSPATKQPVLDINFTTASSHNQLSKALTSSSISMMKLESKDAVVLSFDDVPGPKFLKALSVARNYLSEMGTQLTAGLLVSGYNIGSLFGSRMTAKFSWLFDEYGPVVRFVSPIGSDIVLLNNPEHIKKVFQLEGEYPVRSVLDSLEKYRTEYRTPYYTGLFNLNGEEWYRRRKATSLSLNQCLSQHIVPLEDICENFSNKIYQMRNYQDETTKDLYKEIYKWSFECLGQILFAKRFAVQETDVISSQCDMTWFYSSLVKASDALIKCESGMHMWKVMPSSAWNKLVKYCDSLENLIGKQVMEAEQLLITTAEDDAPRSMLYVMLSSEDKMKTEVITTVLMDMMLLGVNTVSSAASFLLYHLAKYQRVQRILFDELSKCDGDTQKNYNIPYLNACIRETLRLVPPIPVITRVLPKNIVLDKFNIPSGTLVIMSTQEASLKEHNFDDADRFYPERWLKPEVTDMSDFASIPFGFGARKCLGKEVAEVMLRVLVGKMLMRYKLEYHYGDILPTQTFISKPNRQLKLRLIDRI